MKPFAVVAALCLASAAHAQTIGIATMQPGTLAHTVGSSIAKVLKEKAGMNALVQPTSGQAMARAADDFVAGNADAFLFAFGAPKVREVDVNVGGIRALEIPDSPGMAAARQHSPYGYLTEAQPGPVFVGISQPTKVYTFDQMLYTHSAVSDELVYKIIDTMANNKAELAAVAPALREFALENMYKTYDFPYHPGALKYFREHQLAAKQL